MTACTVSVRNGLLTRNVGSGRLAGQQALGVGGDEDDRHVERLQDLVHRFEARAAVGELDVGEHESGFVLLEGGDCLAVGARGFAHVMAEAR